MFSLSGPVLVEARLPGTDAVAAAEDRGGRHRRRAQPACRSNGSSSSTLLPLAHFIGAPGVGRFRRTGERTAQADHAAHLVGRALGELSGIEAAQAPADQAHLATAGTLEELIDAVQHVALDSAAQADVATQLPAVRRVAVRIEEAAQRPRAANRWPAGRAVRGRDGHRRRASPKARDASAKRRRAPAPRGLRAASASSTAEEGWLGWRTLGSLLYAWRAGLERCASQHGCTAHRRIRTMGRRPARRHILESSHETLDGRVFDGCQRCGVPTRGYSRDSCVK